MNDILATGILGILAPGAIIFCGFFMLFLKLKRRTALKLLAWPLTVDLAIAAIAFLMHGGNTYTGGMAATVAGIFAAIGTSTGRHLLGYIEGNVYHAGLIKYDPRSLK